MKKIIPVSAGGASVLIVAILYFILLTPSEDYAITVSPLVTQGPFGMYSHITLKNTGRRPLTDVRVDYGNNTKPDIIPVMDPGQRIILSPPSGISLNVVTVTTKEGIRVVEPYNKPSEGPLVGIGNLAAP